MGRGLARRSVVLAGLLCIALAAGGTAHGSTPRARGASASSRQLVYMLEVRPVEITPQSVSVDADGRGAVIVVIGELTIPKPTRFQLDARSLAKLRALLRAADLGTLHIDALGPPNAFRYTVRSDGHEVRVVEGHIPARLRGLIAFLHALIERYL